MVSRLRVKLTLLFVLLVLLVNLLDAGLGFLLFNDELLSLTRANLVRLCQEIVPVVRVEHDQPTLSTWATMARQINLHPLTTIQVFDSHKHLLEQYGPPGVPILGSVALSQETKDGYISVYSESVPIRTGGYLQVQIPTRQHDEALQGFTINRLLRTIVVVSVLGLCGWFYAGKATEPVVDSLSKLKTFIDDAGHELKTPITIIEQSIETLERQLHDRGIASDILQIIQRASYRLRSLATNLLLLTQLERPAISLNKTSMNVRTFLTELVEEFQEQAKTKQLSLQLDTIPDVYINADRNALGQLFSNLIENAIRYSEPCGTIKVFGVGMESTLILSVQDTGIGIPSEGLPFIFERFYRVDKARSREGGGSGLGLAIVRAIADAHQWTIKVDTAPGRGSTFMVLIALEQPYRPLTQLGVGNV